MLLAAVDPLDELDEALDELPLRELDPDMGLPVGVSVKSWDRLPSSKLDCLLLRPDTLFGGRFNFSGSLSRLKIKMNPALRVLPPDLMTYFSVKKTSSSISIQ